MVSAKAVLVRRSMETVSSAFISSRLTRTWRRVSSGLGSALETGSGLKRAARESAVVVRATDPFRLTAPDTLPGAYIQHMRRRLTDSTSSLHRTANFAGFRDLYVTHRPIFRVTSCAATPAGRSRIAAI